MISTVVVEVLGGAVVANSVKIDAAISSYFSSCVLIIPKKYLRSTSSLSPRIRIFRTSRSLGEHMGLPMSGSRFDG